MFEEVQCNFCSGWGYHAHSMQAVTSEYFFIAMFYKAFLSLRYEKERAKGQKISIFGAAKPVDTASRERAIEAKLQQEREQLEKELERGKERRREREERRSDGGR